MADNPNQQLDKNINIILEAHTKGLKEALSSLGKMDKNLSSVKKSQKALYESGRKLGNVLKLSFKGLVASVTSLGLILKKTGDTMLKFQTTSIGSIKNLQNAYDNMGSSISNTTVSLQALSGELAKFQSKGVAEQVLGSSQNFQAGFEDFFAVLKRDYGASVGADLMEGFTAAFGDNIGSLKKLMTGELGDLSKSAMNALGDGNKAGAIVSLEGLQQAVEATRELTESGEAARKIINSIQGVIDRLKGKSTGLTDSAATFNNVWESLKTTVDDLSSKITQALGKDVAQIVQDVNANFQSWFQSILTGAQEVLTKFNEWGGIKALVDKIIETFKSLWDTLKPMVVFVADLVAGFLTLDPSIQLIIASTVLLAGPLSSIGTIIASIITTVTSLIATVSGIGFLSAAFTFLGTTITSAAAGLLVFLGPIGLAIAGVVALSAAVYGLYKYFSGGPEEIKLPDMPDMPDIPKIKEELMGPPDPKVIKEAKQLTTVMDDLESEFANLITYNRQFDGMSTSMEGLKTIINSLGPDAKIAGQSIKEMMKAGGTKQLITGFEAVDASMKAVTLAQQGLAKATAAEKGAKDPEEAAKKTAFWYERLAKATSAAKKASGAIGSAVETMNASLEKSIDIQQSQIDLRKVDLDISQALYGTPALAVQAQLDIVEAMQKQKALVEDQLVNAKEAIAIAIEKERPESEIAGLQQKAVDLATKAKKITAEQLNMVKQLRDGYLDAVQAQAFGAGRFSKILITQEQNVMRGMQKMAVKRSFLLGQIGDDASKHKAQSYSFGSQGTGALIGSSGQQLDPDAIVQDALKRHPGYGGDTSISDMANRQVAGAAALIATKGTRAGVTREGESLQKYAVPQMKGVPQLLQRSSPARKVKPSTSGANGNSQSKGKEANKHLQIAGRIIEEMGFAIDSVNDGQDSINELRSGAGNFTQASNASVA